MPAYLISLAYTRPIEEVDALHPAHVEWLKQGRADGHFIGWGRKVPREGGVILARGASREAIEQLAASDPFVTGGVARAEVIAWEPSWLGEGLEAMAS